MNPESPSPKWMFRAPRRIEPLPLDRPEQVWFEGDLDEVELRQLAAEVVGVPVEKTRALLGGTRAALREARRADTADVPIEWWAVVEGDEVVGRLYLWAADAGVLFMPADATTPVPEGIVQGSWHGDATIGEHLAQAAAHLKSTGDAPDSQIHHTRFRRRPRRPPPMDRLRAAAARMKKSDD